MTDTTTDPGASGPSDTGPRRRRRWPRWPRWPRILLALGIVVVLLGTAIGVYAYQIDRSVTGNIARGIDLPAESASPGRSTRPAAADRATGTLNYVLLGSDSRDPDHEGNGRSDAIMVVHLDAARTHAWIISFPRDMYIEIPGYGKNKTAAKGPSAGVVADPVTFTNFLGNVAQHVTVDHSLSDDDIRKTALSLRLDVEDIDLMQAPLAGFGSAGGESIDLVDTEKMTERSQALEDDTLGAYLKKHPED